MDVERYGVDAHESLFMSIHCVLHNGKDTEVGKKPPLPLQFQELPITTVRKF